MSSRVIIVMTVHVYDAAGPMIASLAVPRKKEYRAAPAPSLQIPAEADLALNQAAAVPAAGNTAAPALPAVVRHVAPS